MKSIQVAEFFARIGIKADTRQLDMLMGQMKNLAVYTRQLRGLTKNAFKFRTDSADLEKTRQRLGATVSEVRNLRAEIGRLKSINVTANVGANVRQGGGFGGGAGGNRGGGRFGFADGGIGAGAIIRAGIAPVAATVIGTDIVQTSMKIDAARAALLSVTGTAADAQQQFEWLRSEADRIGFTFLDNTRTFTNFLAAGKSVGVGTQEIQEIFRSTAEYGRVLGLSNDDLAGTFRALQQMLSKGTVQSEELKGQLGERLPGAVGLAADALGVTTEQLFKMLENGEVLAKDLLPKLAREFTRAAHTGGAFAKAQKSTAAELARFENQWNDLQDAFARSGFLVAVTKGIDALSAAMEKLSPLVKEIGEGFGLLAEFFEAVFNPAVLTTLGILGFLYLAMSGLLPLIAGLVIVIGMLAVQVIVAAAPWLLLAAGITAVVAIVEDLYSAMTGGPSQFKEWAEAGNPVAKMFLSVAEAITTAISAMKEFLGFGDKKKVSIMADPKGFGNITDIALGTGPSRSMFDAIAGGSQQADQPIMTGSTYNDFNNNFTVTVMGSGDPNKDARAVKAALEDMIGTASLSILSP